MAEEDIAAQHDILAGNPNRNKKARFAWTMYDWANSVYALVITTAIFPPFFHSMAENAAVGTEMVDGEARAIVSFLGFEMNSVALMSFALAIAYLLIGLLSPILGAIADYSGHKKKFMIGFCLIGSVSCSLMYFFEGPTFYLGVWLFIVAAIGFAGGNIFNDAFLPEVSKPQDYDRTSARGYAMGYIGSVLLLLFNLSMMLMPDLYFDVEATTQRMLAEHPGIEMSAAADMAEGFLTKKAAQISFLTVGIWWFGFAQITFFILKDTPPKDKPDNHLLRHGFEELGKVFREMKTHHLMRKYLLAFLFFNMGIQTVMYLATSFGTVELHMETSELIITVLIIQLIAIPGSFIFARLSKLWGNFAALLLGIAIWIGVCAYAWFVTDSLGFYILGAVVGIIMGGMQSLSRSTYSKLLPPTHDTASFFSFYAIVDKIAIVLGTATFGLITEHLGMRNSILALMVFFFIGGWIILSLRKERTLGS